MAGKGDSDCCSLDSNSTASNCKVEAVISVDERGQMVLPKEVRDRAGISPGDKLALISWEKNGMICCMSLIKATELTDMVKNILGPLMGEIMK